MSWRRVSSEELERAARTKKPKRGSAMRERAQQQEDAFQLDFSEMLPFVDLDWENLIGF